MKKFSPREVIHTNGIALPYRPFTLIKKIFPFVLTVLAVSLTVSTSNAQCPTIPTAGGTWTVDFDNASCSFNVPTGVTSMQVVCRGGGGGGGRAAPGSSQQGAGGGGGGGALSNLPISVSTGQSVVIARGGGGAGGTSSTSPGAGGESSLTLAGTKVVWAARGNPGSNSAGGSASKGLGATTGTGTAGTTLFSGGNGADGSSGNLGGGGGGGAGTGANGSPGSGITGGNGGASGGGKGGNGGDASSCGCCTSHPGSGGVTYGAGGAGAAHNLTNGCSFNPTSSDGGSGANGRVSITYTVVLCSTPSITSLSTSNGTVGTVVIIGGSNFSASGNVVKVGGVAATVTSESTTSITATVGTFCTAGLTSLIVTNSCGTASTTTNNFTIHAPAISGFSPTSVCAGSGAAITISGTFLPPATAAVPTVTINGVSATVTAHDVGQITATLPSGATTGAISVTTACATVSGGSNLTVNGPVLTTGVATGITTSGATLPGTVH